MKIESNPSKTVLTIVVGLLAVYFVIAMRWEIDQPWLLKIATIIGLLSVISNYIAIKIEWLWFKLTWVLSLIVPNILLSILFYAFLFPVAILSRITSNKNFLQLKNSGKGTWIDVQKDFQSKDLENPW